VQDKSNGMCAILLIVITSTKFCLEVNMVVVTSSIGGTSCNTSLYRTSNLNLMLANFNSMVSKL